MKLLYLLLVLAGVLLLVGDHGSAYAASLHKQAGYSFVQQAKAFTQTSDTYSHQGINFIKAAGTTDGEKLLFSNENEDENQVSSRKYVLLAKYSLMLSYTLVFGLLYSCFNQRLPLCKHLAYTSSYRYITLRALRI